MKKEKKLISRTYQLTDKAIANLAKKAEEDNRTVSGALITLLERLYKNGV